MQLHITGHQVEVTAAIRAYAEEKMIRIGKHFLRCVQGSDRQTPCWKFMIIDVDSHRGAASDIDDADGQV